MLVQAHDSLKEYKRHIELYRAEIETMRHQLEVQNSDNMAHVVPRLQVISETYNQAISK